MAKIKTTCEGCKKLLRSADAWATIERNKTSRKLCTDCWYKWAGLNNPKESGK